MRSAYPWFLLLAVAACSSDPDSSENMNTGGPQMQPSEDLEVGPITDEDDIEGILLAHNAAREELELEPLEWSVSLANVAAAWADTCTDADADLVIDHNEDLEQLQLGENIWAGTRPREGERAVEVWVDEVNDYNYEDNTCLVGADCGHYTQIVWRDTRQVGCARAECDRLAYPNVLICNYDPPGNIGDEKPY